MVVWVPGPERLRLGAPTGRGGDGRCRGGWLSGFFMLWDLVGGSIGRVIIGARGD